MNRYIRGAASCSVPEGDEPVMCSKCNVTFPTEAEYLKHYNEKHKPG